MKPSSNPEERPEGIRHARLLPGHWRGSRARQALVCAAFAAVAQVAFAAGGGAADSPIPVSGSGPVPAGAARWEPLTPAAWPSLARSLPRPSIVVFTASWCGTCPAIVTALAEHARGLTPPARLVVVMIDGERQAERSTLHGADRLFRLRGDEAALRHAVNPRWRGLVPHVALLGADRDPPVFVDGMPSAGQLARWAGH